MQNLSKKEIRKGYGRADINPETGRGVKINEEMQKA